MKKTLLYFTALILLLLSISNCNKAGKGGSASITGKVLIHLINQTTLDSLTTYEAQDERVYIIYGDNKTFDDDTKTTYNGNFKFNYLYKGEYTIYSYSECLLHLEDCPGETEVILNEVTIDSDSKNVETPTITIKKYIK